MKKIIYHIYYSYHIIEDYLIGGNPDSYSAIWAGTTIYIYLACTACVPAAVISRICFGTSSGTDMYLPVSDVIIWVVLSIIMIVYYETSVNTEKEKYFEMLSKDTLKTKFNWIMITLLFSILSFVYAGITMIPSYFICRL